MILALETSCDDTCAAVVTGAGEVRANVVSSQGVHDRFGGVVPENWSDLKRPADTPLYGYQIDTWWIAPAEAAERRGGTKR